MHIDCLSEKRVLFSPHTSQFESREAPRHFSLLWLCDWPPAPRWTFHSASHHSGGLGLWLLARLQHVAFLRAWQPHYPSRVPHSGGLRLPPPVEDSTCQGVCSPLYWIKTFSDVRVEGSPRGADLPHSSTPAAHPWPAEQIGPVLALWLDLT